MQNFRIGREGLQQLKQLPQAFLQNMVGSVKCNVKETEVLASEAADIAGITLIVTSLITTI